MTKLIRRLARDRSGATAMEYSLIVAGIALTIITALSLFADEGTGIFNQAMDAASTAMEASNADS